MANITEPRMNGRKAPESEYSDPVKAGIKLIKGQMYGVDASGYAVHMESGTVAKARGEVLVTVDNTDGDDGDKKVRGRPGLFTLHILGGDPVTRADLFNDVYAQDNQTVARTSNTGARPKMGRLYDVVGGMAFVAVGYPLPGDGDLVASNNLSDVDDVDVARGELEAGEIWVHVGTVSTKASDSGVLRMPAMRDGTLKKVKTILNGALADANATLQAKIEGSNAGATTSGLVTMTESGSAAGDVDSASPITTNVDFSEDDVLSFHVAGGSTATATCEVYALVEY